MFYLFVTKPFPGRGARMEIFGGDGVLAWAGAVIVRVLARALKAAMDEAHPCPALRDGRCPIGRDSGGTVEKN